MQKTFNTILSVTVFSIILSLTFSPSVLSQNKTDLRFSSQGKFKIVQFTDIHFVYNTPRSDTVLTLIKTILKEEKPDLIVVTGDVVCSENTQKAWIQVTKPFIDAKIPWAITFGNHDDEFEMTRKEIIDVIKTMPYCVTVNGPADISGHGNYILQIRSTKSDNTAALLYCFDSHSYSTIEGLDGYGWINFDQIEWYRRQSDSLTAANNNKPLPAMAFFHIPLPEYNEIFEKETTVGIKDEKPCSPLINSGLFSSMMEKKDVMGVFAGHDHVDNYIGCLHNICLAYGSKTGLENYGYLEKGARVIELYEGERRFKTWLRTLDPAPRFTVIYPASFTEEKK